MPPIAPHSSSTSENAWSASTQEGRIKTPVTQTVAAHFWAWREGGSWPETKSGYKFPHHEVSGSGQPGAANTKACSAVIAVLNGSRGGANIPAADKQGVYDHVAKHLRSAGKEPPPLGADADATEAWCAMIEAENKPGMETCPTCNGTGEVPEDEEKGKEDNTSGEPPAAGDVQTTPFHARSSGTLPPLVPLGHSVWAIMAEVLPRMLSTCRSVPDELVASAAALRAHQAATAGFDTASGVAVVPLTGVITPRGSLLSLLFGGGSGGLEGFRRDFNAAMGNNDVSAVVIEVDSPGGLVKMVPETAAEVFDARGTKPIVAHVNTLAASAAYWIASQADEIVATPSGEAGSIGVYMLHEDWSGANAKAGVVPTFISAGKYKIEGNAEEPLADEARAQWQSEVDDLYGMFTASVAQGRGTSANVVANGYGEGRVLLADRAEAAGLIDRIDTLSGVIADLMASSQSPNPTGMPAGADSALDDARRRAALLFG